LSKIPSECWGEYDLKAIALAFGILILFSGFLLLAASQITNVIPPKKNESVASLPNGQPANVTYTAGAESLSVDVSFVADQVFKVEFALKNFPEDYPEDTLGIYTNITDPFGNVTVRYVLMAPNPQNPYQWVLVPGGDWNLTGVANSTGPYLIKIYPEIGVVTFARLTVYIVEFEAEKVLYPYSYLLYVGVPVFGVGFILSAYGALGKTSRVKRTGRRK